MLMLVGAANRDHRRFPPNGDVFDIHREQHSHMTFGAGTHFCMGNALARLEGRIALERSWEALPEWEVDWDNAKPSQTTAKSGWGIDAHLHPLNHLKPKPRQRIRRHGRTCRRQGRVHHRCGPRPGPQPRGATGRRRRRHHHDRLSVDRSARAPRRRSRLDAGGSGRDGGSGEEPRPPHRHRRGRRARLPRVKGSGRQRRRAAGRLDIVVANAGIGNGGDVLQ